MLPPKLLSSVIVYISEYTLSISFGKLFNITKLFTYSKNKRECYASAFSFQNIQNKKFLFTKKFTHL